MLGDVSQRKKRKVTIASARKLLTNEEAQKLIDMDEVISLAVNQPNNPG